MELFVKRGQTGSAPLPGLPAWLSDLLLARGVDTVEKAKAFLKPEMDALYDPMLLSDMDKAVALIREAKRTGLRAVIYGDYDVDGVCASTIMWDTLRTFGMDAAVYIPDRHEEGYGLNAAAIEELSQKAGLLITVDCGITSVDEVALAQSLGMRVIVTDHHRPPERLPKADALVNPLLNDYPFPSLCGAGVAFKVCQALLSKKAALDCLDLAALATVADMVPLLSENRVLVHFGLKALSETRRPGLKALKQVAALPETLKAEHVAFGLAPRLNASGRLQSALTALSLLQTEDQDEALTIALSLEQLNAERRALERAVQEDALERLKEFDLCASRAIVLCGEGYESGVVGLAAGRIAEKNGYPTVVLSHQGDLAVGSARSAGDVDLFAALSQCKDLLLRFGGHKQAAGMTLKFEDVPALRERLSQAVEKQLNGRALIPQKFYDAEMTLSDVDEDTVARISLLEPCGMGNPVPVFLTKEVEPLTARAVGAQGAHLKLTLRQNGAQRDGIAFGKGDLAGQLSQRVDALFTPVRNEFNGRVSFECRVSALKLHAATLSEDKKSQRKAILQDFCALEQNYIQFPIQEIGEEALSALALAPQGTLFFCRTHQRALELTQRFAQLDFFFGAPNDPRAYSAVSLAGSLCKANAPYRAVVLCDGLLSSNEAALAKRAFGQATLYACKRTAALDALVESLTPTVEELRAIYRQLKSTRAARLDLLARELAMNEEKTEAALVILSQLALIAYSKEPFSVNLLPMQKCNPLASALYQSLTSGKEAV